MPIAASGDPVPNGLQDVLVASLTALVGRPATPRLEPSRPLAGPPDVAFGVARCAASGGGVGLAVGCAPSGQDAALARANAWPTSPSGLRIDS